MSFYIVRIEVPSQTRPRLATSRMLEVRERVVDAASIYFEDGCYNGVGVKFLNRGRQFAPFGSGWVTGNDCTISWNEELTLEESPYKIEILTYNLAADYPHVIEVRIEVIDETIQMALNNLGSLFSSFTNRNKKR